MRATLDIHADSYRADSRVRAHVTGATGFITVSEGDVSFTFYLSVEQTRTVAEALTKGLAERDLIERAKAEAAAQVPA